MNVGKTKAMKSVNTTTDQPVTVNSQQLEAVDEYTYQGARGFTNGRRE